MRQIKFRCWDAKARFMKDDETYPKGIPHMKYDIGLSVGKGWHTGIDGLHVRYDDPELPIMEFTGKQDKNDKDIYEGDIVSVYSELRLVEFKNAFWHLELKEGNVLGGFGTETQAGHKPLYRYPKDWIEVIGNIYETPELLPTTTTIAKH
jgi:hypothetical protein